MRTYETTHPWLRFGADLRQVPHPLWCLLGEARSKCEHIAGVPLPPKLADEFHRIALAKGVWATTAIEGNTLSEDDVRKRIDGQLKLPLSQEYLGQEIDNVVEGCNEILGHVNEPDFILLKPDVIIEFNRLVLKNLDVNEDVVPGKIRNHSVGVADYRGAPAEDCAYLIERMCDWLNDDFFIPKGENQIVYGILRAVLAHLYLVWIHPFGDGNGRTARLLEYQILLSAGIPSPSAHLLSNHYNLTRHEYYRQLQISSRNGGDVTPFLKYAVQGLVDGLRSELTTIRNYQWSITWTNYIYDFFKENDSPADIRRRHLILDMSNINESIPIHKIKEVSVRVARDYANKTDRTIIRDLTNLRELGLVRRDATGYRANKEKILQFLPYRRADMPIPKDK